MPRRTLASAVERGTIPSHRTACGRDTVLLDDVEAFLRNSPGRGFANPDVSAKAIKTRRKNRKLEKKV